MHMLTDSAILSLILAAFACVLAGIGFYRSGKTPASAIEIGNALQQSLEESQAFIAKLESAARLAKIGVEAAQQLWESGQIPEDEEGKKTNLFNYVYDLLHQAYPSLTPLQLEASIESAVYWLKQASQRVALAKEEAAPL